MLLFYIRHGEPIYDPDSLTPLGRRQAEAVAKRLAMYGVDEIYASSSLRARQTAQPTSEITHKDINIMDWCNEAHAWDEFSIEGRLWGYQCPEYREKFNRRDVSELGGKWYTHPLFAGNRFEEGIRRISTETFAFLEKLGYLRDEEERCYRAVKPNDKRIALFAHEGFGMVFLSTLLDIPYPVFCTRFGLSHSSMTVIRFEGEGRVIPCVLQLANDSHLYKEGLPTKYNNEILF